MSTTATAYEVTYIVRPNLEEADVDAKVEKIAATLKDNGAQLGEIEKLINELESLRDLLHAEGERVQREIAGYAQLSQSAMKSTRIIADNMAQWKTAGLSARHQ